jgi:hypothetical protein
VSHAVSNPATILHLPSIKSNLVSQGNFFNVHNTVAAKSVEGGAIQSFEAELQLQREITSNIASASKSAFGR